MPGDKLKDTLEEIVEGIHSKRAQLAKEVQDLQQAFTELKVQRIVRGVYGAILSGMDIFILTPVRCIQAATRTGQGIFTLLLNPLVLYLTFGLAGVFALILVLAEFYKLWRDSKHRDPTYIGSKLIPDADKMELHVLQQKLSIYLDQHQAELEEITAQVAPAYKFDYVGNASIGYLKLIKKSKTDANNTADANSDNAKPAAVEKKKYPETFLDTLANWGSAVRQSRIGKIFWPFWKALQQYSYGYWIVFALALFSGQFAASGVAFSLGIAFGVPAVIPALYLLFRACRWAWRQYESSSSKKDREAEKQLSDAENTLKTAQLHILKTFVLRKLGEMEVKDLDDKLFKESTTSDSTAMARELKSCRAKLEQYLKDVMEGKIKNDVMVNSFDFNKKVEELTRKLKGNERTRKWLGGFFNFTNGYMFGFFAMWPILDLICWLAMGATMFIMPAPIMWGLFAFYLTVGVIYAIHGVYQARDDFRKNADKVDSNANKLKQITYLQLVLENFKWEYKLLSERLVQQGERIPSLYLPSHSDMDCIKRVDHRHHKMTMLELIGDFIKFILQQGGTGAFLIRSILTLGPILLFIGPDPVLFFGSTAMALCIAIAAVSWTGIKIYEYWKTQQYKRHTDFIDHIDVSKDMLLHEIVLLDYEIKQLNRLYRPAEPNQQPIQGHGRFSLLSYFTGYQERKRVDNNTPPAAQPLLS